MKVSKLATNSARRLFRLCFTDGKLDQARLRAVIGRLADEKPRDYRSILFGLQRLLRLEMERRRTIVTSAVELDVETRNRVSKDLAERYGSDLEISWAVDPALLGGMTLRVGDDVLDGSVKGRIERLNRLF